MGNALDAWFGYGCGGVWDALPGRGVGRGRWEGVRRPWWCWWWWCDDGTTKCGWRGKRQFKQSDGTTALDVTVHRRFERWDYVQAVDMIAIAMPVDKKVNSPAFRCHTLKLTDAQARHVSSKPNWEQSQHRYVYVVFLSLYHDHWRNNKTAGSMPLFVH